MKFVDNSCYTESEVYVRVARMLSRVISKSDKYIPSNNAGHPKQHMHAIDLDSPASVAKKLAALADPQEDFKIDF